MSATPIYDARVDKSGKVIFDRPLDWARQCHTLKGAQVEVTLRKRRTQRSLAQNRAYWALVIPAIAEHCGYTKDEAHEAVAWRFLQVGEADAKLPKRRSTADLTVQEFSAYVAQVQQFAAEELGIYIPDPESMDLGETVNA